MPHLRTLFHTPRKLAIDLLLWGLATPLAFGLRFEGAVPPRYVEAMLPFTLVAVATKVLATYLFRLNTQSWRKVTFRDTVTLALALGFTFIVLRLALLLPGGVFDVPRSIPYIDGLLGGAALLGVRGLRRLWDERARQPAAGARTRALIVGAGEAGTMLAREMLRHPEAGRTPVGFVDDDPSKQGLRMAGVPVLGPCNALPTILEELTPDEVLIAAPSAEGRFVRDVVDTVRRFDPKVATRVIPGVYEVLAGDVSVSHLRTVRLEDLLRRAPVRLDAGGIKDDLRDRTVLVTGAGGSIGGEITRQLARFGVRRVLLLGRGENSLHALLEELQERHPGLDAEPIVASAADPRRMRAVFERYRPQVVFHAAAHKHVPLMEAHPEEAVLNNVVGARTMADLALAFGVERFVNVSTDKAVRPSSVMGASKRLAERIVADAADRAAAGQRFVSVRFGNVLGSRGSVVPHFRRQIERGGPVTVTHPDMTRYFMTIPEAAQLVLQAGHLANNGCVYILDMGEPVRIVDLAEDLIRLSGLEPHADVAIEFAGARPGEKYEEELMDDANAQRRAVHEKIYVTTPPEGGRELRALVGELEAAAAGGEADAVRALLRHDAELAPA